MMIMWRPPQVREGDLNHQHPLRHRWREKKRSLAQAYGGKYDQHTVTFSGLYIVKRRIFSSLPSRKSHKTSRFWKKIKNSGLLEVVADFDEQPV